MCVLAQMELGGKDPAIVLPDADVPLAAANIVKVNIYIYIYIYIYIL